MTVELTREELQVLLSNPKYHEHLIGALSHALHEEREEGLQNRKSQVQLEAPTEETTQ